MGCPSRDWTGKTDGARAAGSATKGPASVAAFGEIKLLDQLQMRCPRLGGEVAFTYCEREGGDLPCPRIVICWQPFFPVEVYLGKKLTPEQWQRCFGGQPKEKVATLIELIEAAKQRIEDPS
jgi:hypothetical protein